MKKKLNGVIGLLMILTMIVSIVAVPKISNAATKGYLVLIETKDGKWKSYKDLVYASNGSVMVKAYNTSKILGLTYKNNESTLTIKSNKKLLTLNKNSKDYSYNDGSSTFNKTAEFKTYSAIISKKSTYLVHYSVLDGIVSNFYFDGSDKTAYKNYDGVICYSLSNNDLTLKDIPTKVPASLPTNEPTKAPAKETPEPTKKPTKTPEPTKAPEKEKAEISYDGTVKINGVSIPKLTGFSEAYKDVYWGADNYEEGEKSLINAINAYSKQMSSDIAKMNIEDNPGDLSKINVLDNTILAQINGDSTLSAIRLTKTESGFEIYLSTRLTYTQTDKELGNSDYTKINNSVLRLYTSIITSDGDLLYDTIYKAAEEDSSIINENSYTTIGNFKIKYRVEDRHAIIFSIKAK